MRFILILFLTLSSLEAKIFQTNRIEDALTHLNKSSWLLLDIDDTLLEGENQLGRVEWHYHEIKKRILHGISSERAQKCCYPQWILSQTICPIRTVEPNTASIIAKMQKIAHSVMGITKRHPSIAALSVEQLAKLHIDFSKTAPTLPSHFDWTQTVYRNGVWFISDFFSKGKAFAHLIAIAENKPSRVIFIDSAKLHLEEMEKALESFKIEFIGIHYTKAHERPFDPAIADLQYSSLPEILSDAQAAAILKN